MTKRSITAAVAAAIAVAVPGGTTAAGAAGKSTAITFSASYAGTATVKVADNVANITANGTGSGTLIGTSKISGEGEGDSSVQPCVPFTGPGTLTAANGTKLSFNVVAGSTGCGDEQGNVFSLSGRMIVTGGAGKLLGAKGSLTFTGVYDHGNGTFSVKLAGTLTTGTGRGTSTRTTLRISADKTNKLRLSTKRLSARAGTITILMKNPSILSHDIAIRNGVTAKSKIIRRGAVVKKGGVSKVTVTLKKGRYRFVCTVPGHEAAGMWGILTVT